MPTQPLPAVGWYDTPLYYDIIFDADSAVEAQFLQAAFVAHAGGKRLRRVLEPACGSGRLVRALASRGLRVVGFDANPAMLDFARQRLREAGLRARLLEARLEKFAVGGNFDLAHCLVSTFKYLLTEAQAQAHLAGVARALRPGGIYVLGFHLSDYQDRRCSRERHVGRRGRTHVVCNIQSWPPNRRSRLEKVRSRLMIRQGKQARLLETNWQFRAYSAAQVRRLLRTVPQLEHVATYDFTYDLTQPRAFDDDQLDNVLILRRVA